MTSFDPRNVWTEAQDDVIRRLYVKIGSKGVLSRVNECGPERTHKAIQKRAQAIGACRKMDEYQYSSTPEIDRRIRQLFADESRKRGSIAKLAVACIRPAWWICKRAERLGIRREVVKYRTEEYSEEERKIVQNNAHMPCANISRLLRKQGFVRSALSVASYMKRCSIRNDKDKLMSAGDVGRAMGVHTGAVCRWISEGMLYARRALPLDGDPDVQRFMIEPANLARFIVNNPAAVNLGRVDRFWFIDLLAHYDAGSAASISETEVQALNMLREDPETKAFELADQLGIDYSSAYRAMRSAKATLGILENNGRKDVRKHA